MNLHFIIIYNLLFHIWIYDICSYVTIYVTIFTYVIRTHTLCAQVISYDRLRNTSLG